MDLCLERVWEVMIKRRAAAVTAILLLCGLLGGLGWYIADKKSAHITVQGTDGQIQLTTLVPFPSGDTVEWTVSRTDALRLEHRCGQHLNHAFGLDQSQMDVTFAVQEAFSPGPVTVYAACFRKGNARPWRVEAHEFQIDADGKLSYLRTTASEDLATAYESYAENRAVLEAL